MSRYYCGYYDVYQCDGFVGLQREDGNGPLANYEDAKAEIDRLQQEIAILRARIAELEEPKK